MPPVGEGEGWQEWNAYHKFVQTQRARIRFQIPPPGAAEDERRRIRRIAEHEFTVMNRLNHEGLLAPRETKVRLAKISSATTRVERTRVERTRGATGKRKAAAAVAGVVVGIARTAATAVVAAIWNATTSR